MNITQDRIDNLNSILTVRLNPDDYVSRVEKAIKTQAKKAKIAGFRPGMVPVSHIKQMYGKSILVDEINSLLTDTVSNYITENNLNILGQPLPKINEAIEFNWDFTDEFEFIYEMGLAPEITVDFSSNDRLKQYVIKIDEQLLSERITNLRKGYGKMSNPEISEKDDILYVDLKQLSPDGSIFEEGIITTASLRLDMISNLDIKESLVGLRKEEILNINLPKAFATNIPYIAKLLNITEEEAQHLKSEFQLVVRNINRLEESELNQEFFDKVFGKDIVKNQEEFEKKIVEDLQLMMSQNSEQRLKRDLHELGLEKFTFKLPDEFLKRWLKVTNKKISDNELEEGYLDFAKKLRWSLVENKIVKENNIEIKYEDLFAKVKKHMEAQFRMYNPTPVAEDLLDQSSIQFLKNKDNANHIFEEVKAERVFEYLRNVITLDGIELTHAEFVQLV